jgi:hypothetical protein
MVTLVILIVISHSIISYALISYSLMSYHDRSCLTHPCHLILTHLILTHLILTITKSHCFFNFKMLLEENLEIRLRENTNKWDSLWSTKTA